MSEADIGLIGLAVMGQNLALNMNDHGYKVAVFNRTVSKVDSFLADAAKGTDIVGAHTLEEFFAKLKRPRRVLLMVKAGKPVDEFIEHCLPYLDKGDIILDGGNSYYGDSNRRSKYLEEKGIHFLGTGVSGGEEGARHGPSIMPGGSKEAWDATKEILQSISAKVDNGQPCCEYVGEQGAGHYVKMVHNGIEYGDMQLICEAYDILHRLLGLDYDELSTVFNEWNKDKLDSYLIEITANIFKSRDEDGSPIVEKILDTAGQKGTGKWTAIDALDLGMPLTLIGEAVFARCLSALKDQRVAASGLLNGPIPSFDGDRKTFINAVRDALYASKIISYAQGFMLMQEAAKEYNWKLNYGSIALMWRGGCIIRSAFLGKIKEAFDRNPNLENLMLDPFFKAALEQAQSGWRNVAAIAMQNGIPVPCLSTALSFFDGYRTGRLPANLLQAQRDYFGAHMFERTDQPRGKFFHHDWIGSGGKVHSSAYNV